ncbi:MAG: SUMF1/EgtB/PvdO family nonheme iron enzyme [Pyrinomonadaceae bacterium]
MIHLKVFISSPGDVADERNLARCLLSDELPRIPAFRGRVTFDPVTWDDPAARVPMLVGEQPQESVNRILPKPSECDFVVVILWSRIGTPLPEAVRKSGGDRYASGTEWEYEDAINSPKRPPVLVYRRTEKQRVDLDDPELDSKREQLKEVELFFARFKNLDGSLSGGFNTYATPSEFKELLRQHLEQLVWKRVESEGATVGKTPARPTWDASPFPGLRAFTSADAPIFFGRGLETDALIRKLAEERFVAVIGASGSGKSSLVGAGLIPRLAGGALPSSAGWLLPSYDPAAKQWQGLRFTPGDIDGNPFRAMAAKLAPLVQKRVHEIVARVEEDYDAVGDLISVAAPRDAVHPSALMFIDQLEELFTLCDHAHIKPFAEFLESCSQRDDLHVVVTLRADFYQYCIEVPPLARLLAKGSFPLPPPTDTLLDVIIGPAQRAALEFEEGLAGAILRDSVGGPGALALLAYTLNELYRSSQDKRLITRASYKALGGVQGAIGRRAEAAYRELGSLDPNAFSRVFGELVSVDETGMATRRRAALHGFAGDAQANQLIEAFVNDRLLTISEERQPTVEVAHEALFQHWQRLAQWIRQEQEDLILLRQVRQAAALWEGKGRPATYLWSGERLKEARAMIGRKSPILNEGEREFVRSEVERLMEIISDPKTSHFQRAEIGDRLAMISDTRLGVGVTPEGLPDLAWCEVSDDAGRFMIARYPVTYRQFRCFLDAESETNRGEQFRRIDNCPAENVSFDDAVRFCRWLSDHLGQAIRLPTESEWERAARGPHPDYYYPWGHDWNQEYANTSDSRLSRTTAVGMYPFGRAACGAYDMSGNVWEWTGTEGLQSDDHIIKGGSWLTGAELASVSSRRPQRDTKRGNNVGFRPVLFLEGKRKRKK